MKDGYQLKKMIQQMRINYLKIRNMSAQDTDLTIYQRYDNLIRSICDDLEKIDNYCQKRNRY